MKYLIGILIAIILTLTGIIDYLAGRNNLQLTPGVTTSPVPSTTSTEPVACTMEAKICPDGSSVGRTGPKCEFAPCPEPKTTKVKGGGILSFPKYELTIPSNWESTRESQTKDDEKLTLRSGPLTITIQQGGFGGAMCLYPGDVESEGPSGRYSSYVELTTASGDKLRRSTPKDGKGFGICQLTQYGWGAPTLYGHIGLTVPSSPTPEDLTVIDNILSSLIKI